LIQINIWNLDETSIMHPPTEYIMTQALFNQLCHVSAFNAMNGKTYQEHVLIIAGNRIPKELHESIRNAESGDAALNILTTNKIIWTHTYT